MKKTLIIIASCFLAIGWGQCQYCFIEDTGLVVIEAESVDDVKGWTLEEDMVGDEEIQYIVWKGNNYYNSTGVQQLDYKIKINNPGTYRFKWNSKVGKGSNSTEHNDTWLRISGAADFYGKKGDNRIVHPHGVCTNDCPNGSGSNGWFKVYLSGTTSWTWSSNTSDNDAHQIYAQFDTAGLYTVEVSARSPYHQINRFILYKPGLYDDEEVEDISLKQSGSFPFNLIKPQVLVKNKVLTIKISNIAEDIDTLIFISDNEALVDSISQETGSGEDEKLINFHFPKDTTGEALITVHAVDTEDEDTIQVQFPVKVISFINVPPQIDDVPDFSVDMADGTERSITLSGISDGNDGSQEVFISAKGSNNRIADSYKVNYNQGEDTAVLEYTLKYTGQLVIYVELTDDGGTDLGGENYTRMAIRVDVENTTAVHAKHGTGYSIWPNPVTDFMTISSDPHKFISYLIFNLDGKRLGQGCLHSAHQKISTDNLENGSYILHLIGIDGKNVSHYFVKSE